MHYHLPVEKHRFDSPTIRVQRLDHAVGLELPRYATNGAAGADVRSAEAGTISLDPGERRAVKTGLVFEIPSGWEVQVRPRSGRALKDGLTVVNAPGTIDSDYRGEVCVLLVNLGSAAVDIARGERVAQLVVAPVTHALFREAPALTTTERGAGGFGSTGRG